MAKLQRTFIELVKNPDEVLKGGEAEIEKVWTPHFIPWKTVRASMQTMMELEEKGTSDFAMIEKLESVVVNDVFAGQITIEDLQGRLHAPNAVRTLQKIIEFASYGNEDNDETRDFLEKKR